MYHGLEDIVLHVRLFRLAARQLVLQLGAHVADVVEPFDGWASSPLWPLRGRG